MMLIRGIGGGVNESPRSGKRSGTFFPCYRGRQVMPSRLCAALLLLGACIDADEYITSSAPSETGARWGTPNSAPRGLE